jgi:hypothetical protein
MAFCFGTSTRPDESGKQENRKETFQRLQPAGPGYQMKKRINLFNFPAFLLS